MPTIIECFDSEPLDNIAAQYYFPNARLVFCGYSETMTEERCENVRQFLRLRGCTWEPEFYAVDDDSPVDILDGIVDRMMAALEPNLTYYLDATGGTEIELIAMGRLVERYKVPIFRIIPETGECRILYGRLEPERSRVAISLEEMVTLHGGTLMRLEDEVFPLDAHEREQLITLWGRSKYSPNYFGKLSKVFNELAMYTNDLHVGVRHELEQYQLERINQMAELGFLDNLRITPERMSFDYHSQLARQLLTKTGLALELFTRLAAEKSGIYHEVHQGVGIDWGDREGDSRNYSVTKNEVDVVLLRNLASVWISCKSGDVRKDAFYELEVVADRFGGGYAKKVLVCNNISSMGNAAESLRARARDMGIVVIENVNRMSLDEYADRLAQL